MACEENNTHNRYRERKLVISVGKITMKIAKLRIATYFPEDMIKRYSRTNRAVVAALSEMYANDISTRRVKKLVAKLGIDHMSPSQLSRICELLDQEVTELQSRTF